MPAGGPASPLSEAGGLAGLIEAREWDAGRGKRPDGSEALIITLPGGLVLVLHATADVLTKLGEALIAPSVTRPHFVV